MVCGRRRFLQGCPRMWRFSCVFAAEESSERTHAHDSLNTGGHLSGRKCSELSKRLPFMEQQDSIRCLISVICPTSSSPTAWAAGCSPSCHLRAYICLSYSVRQTTSCVVCLFRLFEVFITNELRSIAFPTFADSVSVSSRATHVHQDAFGDSLQRAAPGTQQDEAQNGEGARYCHVPKSRKSHRSRGLENLFSSKIKAEKFLHLLPT